MDAGMERHWQRHGAGLSIGLVNNSPLAAFHTTEAQFSSLLHEALVGTPFQLHVFSVPGILDELDRRDARLSHCLPFEMLPDMQLDALIVTGCEPSTAALSDEVFWVPLVQLFDWAEAQAFPVMVSCLAAHAAVQHQTGIRRRALTEKRSGIFMHMADTGDRLMQGISPRYLAPHSRCNEVGADALQRAGYKILSHSAEAGVEMFSRPGGAGWLYLQGHPEYAPQTLANQFRRDLVRFTRHELPEFPAVPRGVFAAETVSMLQRLSVEMQAGVTTTLPELIGIWPTNPWRAHAVQLFSNWARQATVRLASAAMAA